MRTGVLFVHGFTGGSFEVRPLIRYFQSLTDWEIVIPTLSGHDFPLALDKVSAESWLMEAEQALRQLMQRVDRVVVVGFSMGGLIAMYLALRYPVDRLVLLSPAAKYLNIKILFEDAPTLFREVFRKKHPPNTFYHLFPYKFTRTPWRATYEFLRIVKTIKPYYANITTPVFIVQGRKDGIVPFETCEYLARRLGSTKKTIWISERGHHHICYSDDCDEWFRAVYEFITTEQ